MRFAEGTDMHPWGINHAFMNWNIWRLFTFFIRHAALIVLSSAGNRLIPKFKRFVIWLELPRA